MAWYKDDLLLFNGTEFSATSGLEPSSIVLQRTVSPEYQTKGSAWSRLGVMTGPGLDTCVTEEYTLLLKNLTLQDSGNYRCQLLNYPQQLDFHLDVLGKRTFFS